MRGASRRDPKEVTDQSSTTVVTMLGISGSGKTTYIVGMYAQLVQGFRGCYMHTPDHDAGKEMIDQLAKLRDGDLPEHTLDKAIPHDYVLRSDEGQFALDLADYRGGAPFDLIRGNDHGDTAQLLRRLSGSHSIFVTLDSTHFLEPITPDRLHAVRQSAGADRFSDLISKAVADKQQRGLSPPSIAVLVTKADLFYRRPGTMARDWDDVMGEVREVLGGAFQPGVDTRIIPVSVGEFGAPEEGHSPGLTIQLHALADPVIFAAGTFLKAQQATVQQHYRQAVESTDAARRALGELTTGGPIIRWFRRNKIAAADGEVATVSGQADELANRWRELGKKAEAMLSRLGPGADGE
jgi:hypothetical protein